MLAHPGKPGDSTRTILAAFLPFLFEADEGWTIDHLVPLFDWQTRPVYAAQVWDGYSPAAAGMIASFVSF